MTDAHPTPSAAPETHSRSIAWALWTLAVFFAVAVVYGMVRDYEPTPDPYAPILERAKQRQRDEATRRYLEGK